MHQTLGVHMCADLYLGPQFDSIDQFVCLYANTAIFITVALCYCLKSGMVISLLLIV